MQLTLIRHLPTEWNKNQKLQGKRDIEISLVTEDVLAGIEENKRLLKLLAPFDRVLASTLKRTHQTAYLYGYTCETEALLDELDFGVFEGEPKVKLLERYKDSWIEKPEELVLGESLQNFAGRIVSFLEKYKDQKNVLVFGHGSWIRAAVSLSRFGHINNMNKIMVENNECITLTM